METQIDFSSLSQEEQNSILQMIGNIYSETEKEQLPDDYCEVLSVE